MSSIDLIVIVVGLIAFALWMRACKRASPSDAVLALAVAVVAGAVYFVMFRMARAAYLPAMIFAVMLLATFAFSAMRKSMLGKIMAACLVLLTAGAGLLEHQRLSAGNALLVIEPYRSGKGGWRFDEPRLGLKGEPFVEGIPEMIDQLAAEVGGPDTPIRLIFSQNPFPNARRLDRRHQEHGGHWYYSEDFHMQGWLCPALFLYFPRAPEHIYVKAEAR